MDPKGKRMLGLLGMGVFLTSTTVLLVLGEYVFAGTALVLFSFSLYFYEIHRE